MLVSSCLSPKLVKNPYTHKYVKVACGKCDGCRNLLSYSWVDRLQREQISHRYCVFFTLTYSDYYLPLYRGGSCHPVDTDKFGIPLSVECEDWQLSPSTLKYGALPVLSHNHVSLFINNLKKIYGRHSFTWFVCGEYGTIRLRPHYHGLLFFDNSAFCGTIKQSIIDSWSNGATSGVSFPASEIKEFGRVDVQFVSSSATNYVAQYVNATAELPRCLRGCFRQFHTQSRAVIGTDRIFREPLAEIYHRGLAAVCEVSRRDHSEVITELPSYIARRLFPEVDGVCLRFGNYDNRFVRAFVEEYRLLSMGEIESLPIIGSFASRGYYQSVSYGFGERCVISNFLFGRALNRLSAIKRFCRRVLDNVTCYGGDISYALSRIDEYVSNRELFRLREFYKLQNDLTSSSVAGVVQKPLDPRRLVSLYSIVRDDGSLVSERSLQSFGLTSQNLFMFYDINKIPSFQDYSLLAHKIALDNVKTKKRNQITKGDLI